MILLGDRNGSGEAQGGMDLHFTPPALLSLSHPTVFPREAINRFGAEAFLSIFLSWEIRGGGPPKINLGGGERAKIGFVSPQREWEQIPESQTGKEGGLFSQDSDLPPFHAVIASPPPLPLFRNISFFLRWAGRPFCLDIFCSIHGRLG